MYFFIELLSGLYGGVVYKFSFFFKLTLEEASI